MPPRCNSNPHAGDVVSHFPGVFTSAQVNADLSPLRWAELIQLPSLLRRRSSHTPCAVTRRHITFAGPSSSSWQKTSCAKPHWTDTKVECRNIFTAVLIIARDEQCYPYPHHHRQFEVMQRLQKGANSFTKLLPLAPSNMPSLYKQNIPFALKGCVDLVSSP